MTDVFISYSRKDKAFVQKLHEALQAENRDTWVDWESIPLTADWWAEIQEGIENADAFVFIISPASVTSEVCHQEIDHAAGHNKRLIPIVYRDASGVPEDLAHLNWIFCRDSDNFEDAFQNLLGVMDTDLAWVKQHTRLTRRAVEWDKRGRNDSYLLRGDDLAQAEGQLSQPDREPVLTQLQQEYIVTSQRKQAAELMQELEQARTLAETERKRLAEQAYYDAKLRKRLLGIIGGLVLIIALGGLSIYIYFQRGVVVHSAEEVVDVVVEFGDAKTNGDVCRAGALNGLPDMVLPACHKAIALQSDVSFHYESRGLAYQMMGKFREAEVDFRKAIELAQSTQHGREWVREWEQWVSRIDRKEPPFDDQLLHDLREDWKADRQQHDDQLLQ